MKLALSEIKQTKPQRDQGDIEQLSISIRKHGLLQPVVVNQNNEIIAGRRRFAAVQLLKWETVDVHKIETSDDIDKLSKTIAENVMRKDLTWQEEVQAKEELDGLMRIKHGSAKPGQRTDLTSAEVAEVWTTKKTAEMLREPERTTQADIQLAKEVKEHPELAHCKNKKEAMRKVKVSKQIAKSKDIVKSEGFINILDTKQKFRIIYADPAWKYNDKLTEDYGGTDYHYATLSIGELCALPIQSIAEKDAVLLLWVTSPLLEECFKVISAWGFKYKTSFVWDKVKHNMGHYNSLRHEFLLICTRGSCVPDNNKLYDSVVSEERKGHSQKPDLFYDIIEDLYQHGDKIELFARKKRKGWAYWGNEI